jgi:glycosyltransferase involved in cell wall biosynthesis
MNVGGPSRHVTILTTRSGPDFDPTLLAGEPDAREGSMEEEAIQRGARVIHISSLRRNVSPLEDAQAMVWLYRYFRRERPVLVATHLAKAGTLGRLAATLARVPVRVHTFHGHVLDGYFGRISTFLFLSIERFLSRHTTHFVAISPEIAGDLDRLGIGRGKTSVVRLGLELEQLAGHPRGTLRRELGIPAEAAMVGIVGRLVPIKAHDLFLDAAARVVESDPDVHFVVVGDGELWAELHRQASAQGLDGRVHFTGWRQDLGDVYSDLDVVVCCSRNEGTPVSLIEACASERPVIGTRVGGVPDIITPGVNGLLVPSGDVPALAAAIKDLIADPARRAAMGVAGRRLVLERHGADRMVKELEDLYRSLLAAPALNARPV